MAMEREHERPPEGEHPREEPGEESAEGWFFDLPGGAWERQEAKNRELRQSVVRNIEGDRRSLPPLDTELPPPQKRGLFGLGRKKQEPRREPRETAGGTYRLNRGASFDDMKQPVGDFGTHEDSPPAAPAGEDRHGRFGRREGDYTSASSDADEWTTEPTGPGVVPFPARFGAGEDEPGDDDAHFADEEWIPPTESREADEPAAKNPVEERPRSRWDETFGGTAGEGSILESMRGWARKPADAPGDPIASHAAPHVDEPADVTPIEDDEPPPSESAPPSRWDETFGAKAEEGSILEGMRGWAQRDPVEPGEPAAPEAPEDEESFVAPAAMEHGEPSPPEEAPPSRWDETFGAKADEGSILEGMRGWAQRDPVEPGEPAAFDAPDDQEPVVAPAAMEQDDPSPPEQAPRSRWDEMFSASAGEGSILEGMKQWASTPPEAAHDDGQGDQTGRASAFAAFEPEPAAEPGQPARTKEKKPGLFGRMFGRKKAAQEPGATYAAGPTGDWLAPGEASFGVSAAPGDPAASGWLSPSPDTPLWDEEPVSPEPVDTVAPRSAETATIGSEAPPSEDPAFAPEANDEDALADWLLAGTGADAHDDAPAAFTTDPDTLAPAEAFAVADDADDVETTTSLDPWPAAEVPEAEAPVATYEPAEPVAAADDEALIPDWLFTGSGEAETPVEPPDTAPAASNEPAGPTAGADDQVLIPDWLFAGDGETETPVEPPDSAPAGRTDADREPAASAAGELVPEGPLFEALDQPDTWAPSEPGVHPDAAWLEPAPGPDEHEESEAAAAWEAEGGAAAPPPPAAAVVEPLVEALEHLESWPAGGPGEPEEGTAAAWLERLPEPHHHEGEAESHWVHASAETETGWNPEPFEPPAGEPAHPAWQVAPWWHASREQLEQQSAAAAWLDPAPELALASAAAPEADERLAAAWLERLPEPHHHEGEAESHSVHASAEDETGWIWAAEPSPSFELEASEPDEQHAWTPEPWWRDPGEAPGQPATVEASLDQVADASALAPGGEDEAADPWATFLASRRPAEGQETAAEPPENATEPSAPSAGVETWDPAGPEPGAPGDEPPAPDSPWGDIVAATAYDEQPGEPDTGAWRHDEPPAARDEAPAARLASPDPDEVSRWLESALDTDTPPPPPVFQPRVRSQSDESPLPPLPPPPPAGYEPPAASAQGWRAVGDWEIPDDEEDVVVRAFEAHASTAIPGEDPAAALDREAATPMTFSDLLGDDGDEIVAEATASETDERPFPRLQGWAPQRSVPGEPPAAAWAPSPELVATPIPGFDRAFAPEPPPWEPTPAAETAAGGAHAHSRGRTLVRELVETALLALLVFLTVRASFQNFKVDGSSMYPTLENGQFLIVNKLVYAEVDMDKLGDFIPFVSGGDHPTRNVFHPPDRGEIIVLKDPRQPETDLIKRIIGLPGETIEIVDGKIYINDQLLVEPYIKKPWHDSRPKVLIGADEYFVMGDNRENSLDSRALGLVHRDLIIGKAMLSYWPTSKFGLAPNGSPKLTEKPVVTTLRIGE